MRVFIISAMLIVVGLVIDSLPTVGVEERLVPASSHVAAAIACGLGASIDIASADVSERGDVIVYRRGSLYELCTIGAECSGLRTMFALTLLALTYRYYDDSGKKKRSIVRTVAASVALGFALNAWRIALIIYACERYGRVAGTAAHDYALLLIIVPTILAYVYAFRPFINFFLKNESQKNA